MESPQPSTAGGIRGQTGGYPFVAGPRALLHSAVDAAWERVKSRLMSLSRESVIERSLLNYVAVRKEHRDWMRSTSARLSLYDAEEVIAASHERVVMRDSAGLACRIIAEMALCTSPYDSGSACTGMDLDFLVAEVSTLVECASQSDALKYGLATRPPVVHPNGSFGFHASATQAAVPLMTEHWRRAFRDAAQEEEGGGNGVVEEGMPDPGFPFAFAAEFGVTLGTVRDVRSTSGTRRCGVRRSASSAAQERSRQSTSSRWRGEPGTGVRSLRACSERSVGRAGTGDRYGKGLVPLAVREASIHHVPSDRPTIPRGRSSRDRGALDTCWDIVLPMAGCIRRASRDSF